MSEEYLIKHCAPTVAGIKTGNLFSCIFSSRKDMLSELKHYNRIFTPKGLFLIPLKISGNRVLLYLFRKERLEQDLSEASASIILRKFGYKTTDYRSCLTKLVKKLNSADEFPHEIGLFLSYPPEDVRGFMENRDKGCKFVGYWKVYGDEASARHTFSKYDRCTTDYRMRIRNGAALDRLIVSGVKYGTAMQPIK